MTTEQLEKRVEELELTLNGVELNVKCLKDELSEIKRKLEDASKPKISKEFMGEISSTVCRIINNFEFNDPSFYEYEFELSYENKIQLSHIKFNYADELEETIVDELEYLFNVTEDDKDEVL